MKYKNYKWDDISEYITYSKLTNIVDVKDIRHKIYTLLEHYIPFTTEKNILYSINNKPSYILNETTIIFNSCIRRTLYDIFGNVIHHSFLDDITKKYCMHTFGIQENRVDWHDMSKLLPALPPHLNTFRKINEHKKKPRIGKYSFKYDTFAKILEDVDKNKECKEFLDILDYLIYDISENGSYSINNKCLYYLKNGILRYDINKFCFLQSYPLTDAQKNHIVIDFVNHKFGLNISSFREILDLYHPNTTIQYDITRDEDELSKYCYRRFLM